MADDNEGSGTTLIIVFIILLLCGCGAFYFFYYRYTTGWTTISDVSVDPSLNKPDATEISLYKAQKTAYDNNNLAFFIVSNGASTYDVYYYPPGKNAPKPASGKAKLYYKNAPNSSSDESSSATSTGGSSSATSTGGSSSATSTGGSSSATSTGGSSSNIPTISLNPYGQFVNINIPSNDISGGGTNMTNRQCQFACDTNTACKAFVMGGPDGKTCKLKSDSGPVVITGDITTSYIRPVTGINYAYINQYDMYSGGHNTPGGAAKTDPIAGASACDANPACQGFVINNSTTGGGGTYLKTDTGSYLANDKKYPWVSNSFVKATDNLLHLNTQFVMKHVQSGKYVAYDSATKLSGCAETGMAGSLKLVNSKSDATPITASINTGLYHWDSSGVVALKIGTNQFIRHCDMWLLTTTAPPTYSGGDYTYGWKFIPVTGKFDTYITYNYYNSYGIEIGSNNYLKLGGDYTTDNKPTGETPLSTVEWKLEYVTNSRTSPSGTSPSGTSPSGTSPSGTSPSGTSPSGTSPSGTSPSGTSPIEISGLTLRNPKLNPWLPFAASAFRQALISQCTNPRLTEARANAMSNDEVYDYLVNNRCNFAQCTIDPDLSKEQAVCNRQNTKNDCETTVVVGSDPQYTSCEDENRGLVTCATYDTYNCTWG